MQINKEDNTRTGRYFIDEHGNNVAEMVYVWTDSKEIDIRHTGVNDSLKGQGIGKKLLTELIAWVRAEKIKIFPSCPYVKAIVGKSSDYNDVLSDRYKH